MNLAFLQQSVLCSFDSCPEQLSFGKRSEEALLALQSVISAPQTVPKVIVVCGDIGIGKTCLMRKVASELQQKRPAEHHAYLTADALLTDLILQISRGRGSECVQSYASMQTLIVDDVSLLAGKSCTISFLGKVAEQMQDGGHLILIVDLPAAQVQAAFSALQPVCYELLPSETSSEEVKNVR